MVRTVRTPNRRSQRSLVSGALVGALVSPAFASTAGAHPVDAAFRGCFKDEIRFYEVDSSEWTNDARYAVNSALTQWGLQEDLDGDPWVDLNRVSSAPGSSSGYDRVKLDVGSVLGLPVEFGALGTCASIPQASGAEGIVQVHPSVMGLSLQAMYRLFTHEIGHIMGLGHTGFLDNWRDSNAPIMATCSEEWGAGVNRSFQDDDDAALNYNRSTDGGSQLADAFASANPGFETTSAGFEMWRHGGAGTVTRVIDSPYAERGDGFLIWDRTTILDWVSIGARIANMNDTGEVTPPGHNQNLRARASFKALSRPAKGAVYVDAYARQVEYADDTGDCNYPIDGGFLVGDHDLGRNYNDPDIAAHVGTNPIEPPGQWVRWSSDETAFDEFEPNEWTVGSTSADQYLGEYVEDHQVVVVSTLMAEDDSAIDLAFDNMGVVVEGVPDE